MASFQSEPHAFCGELGSIRWYSSLLLEVCWVVGVLILAAARGDDAAAAARSMNRVNGVDLGFIVDCYYWGCRLLLMVDCGLVAALGTKVGLLILFML